jgi:hypothetical protein
MAKTGQPKFINRLAGMAASSAAPLEQFHKCCSAAEKLEREAVFLTFGFVSARSQATLGVLPRQSLAQSQKSSLRRATSFLSML